MQWLAALCVRRPVFAWVLVLSLTVVGLFAFGQLGVDRFPNVDVPTISVTTRLPGAAPEQIETEVTDKIVVEEVNLVLDKERAATYGIERAPALVLLTNGQDTRIRFFGAPAGYDFMAMVDAILAVSGASDSDLSDESVALVSAVTEPTRIQVFVTPTCVYCPRAVALANRMALLNPNITSTTVVATEFHELARKFRVTGVPKTVVNESIEVLGALPEPDFIRAALAIAD